MASRCLEEERDIPLKLGEGTEQAPATAAAERATDDLALAVLAPPGPPQLTILGQLEQEDKLNLGATCTSLQQASLVWFPEVAECMNLGETDVAALADWLARHHACLHLCDFSLYDDGTKHGPLEAEWNDSLTALPASLVVSLTTGYQLCSNVSTLTALTRLELEGWSWKDCSNEIISHRHLQPLTRLRQLSLKGVNIGSNAEELQLLPAGLQALNMSSCSLQTMPRALAAHTQLTALDLSNNLLSTTESLATLQRLQSLDLSCCKLGAVPAQLSVLTALTHLDLGGIELLNRGWQHLAPLIQLQRLALEYCSLIAVPQELSALTALTELDLSHNDSVGSNWQHLLHLTQLRHLDLPHCDLTALPQQLSALTALTSLDLTALLPRCNGWQHLLPLVQLRALKLKESMLKTVPEQVSALTALTRLNLAGNNKLNGGCQHLLFLTQLQDLDLSGCKLKTVPDQLSALAALTRLNLHANKKLAGGWQNLLCLTLLLDLNLCWCRLTTVPEQCSVLTALVSLNLARNRDLAGGWQHLLPLTQLRFLGVKNVRLPAQEAQALLAALPDLSVEYDGRCW
ncbi:Leucine-rich repeat protein [Chlorella vulgaris]